MLHRWQHFKEERDTVQVPTVIGKDRYLKSIPEEMTELVLTNHANVSAKWTKPLLATPA